MRTSHPGHHRRRRFAVVSVFLAAFLLVFVEACSSAESGTTASTSSETSPTKSSATTSSGSTSAVPKPPVEFTSKDLDGTVHALGTVYTPCPNSGREFAVPRVLDLSDGKFVTPVAPTSVPSGSELLNFMCSLAGTPEDLEVLYVWSYKTPAAGLSPETFTIMAAATGIHDTTPLQSVDLSSQIPYLGSDAELLPTRGATVLDAGYGCEVCTFAISTTGPKMLWSTPQLMESHDDVSVAFKNGNSVVIRGAETGQDITVDNVRLSGSGVNNAVLESGYLLVEQGGLGDWIYGYYSTVANKLYSGTWVGDPPQVKITDGRALFSQKNGLRIINISTGAIEFELNSNEMNTLDSYQFTVFGKYLYVINKNDSPVLDINTKQRVSTGWKVRPSEWLNDSWLIVDKRNTGTGTCYQSFVPFDCKGFGNSLEDFTLSKINSDRYTGPYF